MFPVFYFISNGLILDILNLMKKIPIRLTDFIMVKTDILLSVEYEYLEVFQCSRFNITGSFSESNFTCTDNEILAFSKEASTLSTQKQTNKKTDSPALSPYKKREK